ncbi:MAG: hypothetical protein IPP61_05820 [Cytophagaceae bacterium]|nr:hypothetical protein [Cytophagaceae bacterium]MBK9935419.1 hypothetical protein [Cytophagaceae bacterium]MBL0301861.1 hypothetical protein [Cytophagaceae bacterium]MBL0324687.1 hypothetical protein [Cytophagaceae bacterium]
MLKYTLTILFTSIHFFCFPQLKNKDYDFYSFDLKLDKHVFNLVEVIDNRDFSHIYGKEYFLSNEFNLVNHTDFAREVKDWYIEKFPVNPKLPNIAVKIQDISVSKNRINNDLSSCTGMINVYLVKNGKYQLIAEYGTKIYGKPDNYPYSVMHDVFSIINDELINTVEEYPASGINNIETIFQNDFTKPVPGIYRFYEDFKTGFPSDSLTKKYYDFLPKNEKMNFRLGKLKKTKIYWEEKEIEENFWGYSDGENIFMRIDGNFFVKIMKYNDTFYFDLKNIDLKDKNLAKADLKKLLTTGFFIHFSPDFILSTENTKNLNNDLFFTLNKENGTITKFNKANNK